MIIMMSSALAVLCLLLHTGALGFEILRGTLRHQEITERAILNTTVQVCQTLAQAAEIDFAFPAPPFTTQAVAVACRMPKSQKSFRRIIKLVQNNNVWVDWKHIFDAEFHFDGERFVQGRQIITDGLQAIKASNKKQNFEAARITLGGILHTLQDFYSHSNWVELGNKFPNPNLIRSGTTIGNIASEKRETCRNCDADNCANNILEDIIQENILTSGYFGFTKPNGKCSHGGLFDLTSYLQPKGGINKDKPSSEHGHLHTEAANLAIAATSQLLEDIRRAAGDTTFLQMMGMSRGRPLCFVIDTTGSMSNDIEAVKTVTSYIINSKVGTEDEPSVYILVPFNDPEFGPLIRTTDPNIFKKCINSLTASGGGDAPEMSLSGLQLALTGAPSGSEIFLFTDAPAKDEYLKSTVTALIERTKTVVNFMITSVLWFRHRRQSDNNQHQRYVMVKSDVQLYKSLAKASGGQVIEVKKTELLSATSIIQESTTSSLVTLLLAFRNPGRAENFTVTVDESVRNLTVYITGRFVSFTLISPSGVLQSSADITGSLISASHLVGNFQTLQLNTQVGLWQINMVSTNPYTLKVVGESAIDFLFDFLEPSQNLSGGFEVVNNRPRAGLNGSLMVTVTGSDSATVTGVTLVETSGSGEVNGSVEAQGGRDFLVRFDKIPSVEFVLLVKGLNSSTSLVPFQRQSATSIRASAVTITVNDSNSILVPGTPIQIPFSVTTSGSGGNFSIQATNDRNFTLDFPSSLSLETGGSTSGTVIITAPSDTLSGTAVTLTIEAAAPGAADTNYAVLRFTALQPVTDFAPPVCQLLSLQSNCSDNCSLSAWDLSVQVTDGNQGTGIERVSLKQGSGDFNTSLAAGNENITLVSYNTSCCSPDVELVVVDKVGNVGSCLYTVQKTSITQPVSATTATSSPQTQLVVSLGTKAVQSSLLCVGIFILASVFHLN